ncbi:hypothetical protein K474DRAFT_1665531 [Panus rudis PR-1116 ss-1]|nr:hypothetical protein K474DRAFT_1665531 [Panus rudis PR-1116 ss-1]
MRAVSFIVALSGFVATASAATLFARQYPDCANPCIANADIGSCSADDLGCLCKNPDFISSTTSCILSSCSADDATKAEATARSFCETVGVTLTSTPAATSTSASQSSASSGSSSATSAAPSGSATSPSSASSASPSATGSPNGAMTHGVNALAGLAAVGLAALAL